ncbi:MAG: glycosyl transferase [Sulfobacillus acidophilus]|uniref:Glycosyl transferase n=1 Tax=Sulfobacillus acidophilus TaxID=53633 RepID=A0A2T2WL99_9FIRM|nr:MAG: glycosyl transferase [Sulfobacillus acidophilus]
MSLGKATWPPFLWGVATSSHQIEGNQHNDWTRWEQAGRVAEPSGRSCDHWNLWPSDFSMLHQLRVNSYRFSLEWSRIEPRPGEFDAKALGQYRAMLQRLRELKIIPLVTLHHFTLPLWVSDQGGFLHPKATTWFIRYVTRVMHELGDLADLYVTINEPLVLVVMGYLIAQWPPGQHGFARALRLINRLRDVHQAAYETIKAVKSNALVGLAHHLIAFEPWTNSLPDRGMAHVVRYLMNDRFVRMVRNHQDFIGVNYYTRQYAHWSQGLHPIQNRAQSPLSDLGWEIYPQGLLALLRRLKVWQKPILITENGIATRDDSLRTTFLQEHLKVIGDAQRQGIDVRGYYHWSFLDNFEWAEGYAPRFGLVEVDYQTLTRHLRPTALRYRAIIEANRQRYPISVP